MNRRGYINHSRISNKIAAVDNVHVNELVACSWVFVNEDFLRSARQSLRVAGQVPVVFHAVRRLKGTKAATETSLLYARKRKRE